MYKINSINKNHKITSKTSFWKNKGTNKGKTYNIMKRKWRFYVRKHFLSIIRNIELGKQWEFNSKNDWWFERGLKMILYVQIHSISRLHNDCQLFVFRHSFRKKYFRALSIRFLAIQRLHHEIFHCDQNLWKRKMKSILTICLQMSRLTVSYWVFILPLSDKTQYLFTFIGLRSVGPV